MRRAALTGAVEDPSGGVLPGVTITARNAQTGTTRTAVTDGSGNWTMSTLPTGKYDLSFELDSFKKLVRSDVTVEAAVARTVNVSLEVGSLTEAVTVTADAALLTATTAATFRKIDGDELTNVPTSTRSFTHLLSGEAGVSADLPPVLINGTGNISPSVNGTRTTSTSLFFNGIDATNITSNEGSLTDNISPAPEMLDEVKLQTSLYDASTGRSGGGNFQLITRSGTNALHGSGFFNFQHEALNANDFFYNKDGIEKPKARRNEGGFTVGGPIKKNRVVLLWWLPAHQRGDWVCADREQYYGPARRARANRRRTHEREPPSSVCHLNPGILASIPKAQCASATDTACISDVALNLFTLRNPVTGDYVIPAPRAGLATVGVDGVAGLVVSAAIRWFGNGMSFRPSSSRTSPPPRSTRN